MPKLEVERLYIPTTVRLGGNKTNAGASSPEYDRLWAGGVNNLYSPARTPITIQ